MSLFDPKNPFPLVPEDDISYLQEKDHAHLADAWLGFEIQKTEEALKSLYPKDFWSDLWIGLPPESLQTPYTELRRLLELVKPAPGARIIDLGCAYGRMAHVLHHHFSETQFLGIESASLRAQEGQRILALRGQKPQSILHSDFTQPSFEFPVADIYFVYDSSTVSALEVLLQKLRPIAVEKKSVVVGRGRRIRDMIERGEPWLSQVHPPRHFKNFSIYQA